MLFLSTVLTATTTKAVWPATEADASKAAQMAKDAIPLNGAYGYNNKGEGVAPAKK